MAVMFMPYDMDISPDEFENNHGKKCAVCGRKLKSENYTSLFWTGFELYTDDPTNFRDDVGAVSFSVGPECIKKLIAQMKPYSKKEE